MQAFERVAAARSAGNRQRDVVKESGLSRGRVSNLDRIAKKARPQWLSWVEQGLLTLKHLEAVLMLQQPKAEDLLRSAMAGKWSCQKLRTEVKAVRGGRRDDDPHADADVARCPSLNLVASMHEQRALFVHALGHATLAGFLGCQVCRAWPCPQIDRVAKQGITGLVGR